MENNIERLEGTTDTSRAIQEIMIAWAQESQTPGKFIWTIDARTNVLTIHSRYVGNLIGKGGRTVEKYTDILTTKFPVLIKEVKFNDLGKYYYSGIV